MKHPQWFIGGDPGENGGMAAISFSQEKVLWMVLAKENRDDLSVWLQQFNPLRCKCVAEWNSSSPQMGVASSFTFGKNCERIPMALVALGFKCGKGEMVRPIVWQKALGVKPRYKEITGYTKPKKPKKAVGFTQRKKPKKPRPIYQHTETKDAFKCRLWGMAVELYPQLQLWTLPKYKQMAICDAILMAEYCRRLYIK